MRNSEGESHTDSLPEGVRSAAQASSLAGLGSADNLDARTLIGAMGGIRGILEAVVPGLLFLIAFTITQEIIPAIIAAGAVGVVFTVVRLLQKQTLLQAITGLVGIALSAALALLNDKPEDYYLIGFWTNGAYLFALVVSVLVRWPLIGVVVGLLTGEGSRWRSERAVRRAYGAITLIWAGMFAARLAVQLPLYFAGNVEALGTLRLLMGIPLYAPLLAVTWLMVTALRKRRAAAEQHPRT